VGHLLTPEQGQDFQHHARCLRKGVDSGLPENGMEVQAETDTQPVVVVTVSRLIPVTVSRAAILRIIVPGTATQLNPAPYPSYSTFSRRNMTPQIFSSLRSEKRRKKKREKGKRTKDKV
jgi:hypothetical protein